ncbi:MAG TPA: hypothetical protein VGK38_10755 [Prolixibacteraceae bacterium]|jgi:hypothetical protein
MGKLKVILKVLGLILFIIFGVIAWFWLGSCITRLIFSADSNVVRFASILLLAWFFRAGEKVLKVFTETHKIQDESN